MLPVIQ